MLPLTEHSLHKLENLLKANNYIIRYEKGNFQSGTCTLLQNKILVINNFSDLEVKITSLIQVIAEIDFLNAVLDEKQKKLLTTIKNRGFLD